jgi:hypothetical protein
MSLGHKWQKTKDSTDAAWFYVCKKCGIGAFSAPQKDARMFLSQTYQGLVCDECKIQQVMQS